MCVPIGMEQRKKEKKMEKGGERSHWQEGAYLAVFHKGRADPSDRETEVVVKKRTV